MARFGCPRQFHDVTQARVQNDGEYSEPFPVTRRCHGTNTVQLDVLCHAHRCFSGM